MRTRTCLDFGVRTVERLAPTIDSGDDMTDVFDVAEARGVYPIGEVPWPEGGPQDFIEKWKHRDAIVGWNIQDDFNAPF